MTPFKPLDQPACADAARKTLAARLVRKKGHRAAGNLHHVPAVVEDDDAPGAQKGPVTAEAGFVQRRFKRGARYKAAG